MRNITVNLTGKKVKPIIIAYVIGFMLLTYLGNPAYLRYLTLATSYSVLYLMVFTLTALYFESLIVSLKRRNLLDVFVVVTYILGLIKYFDFCRYAVGIL